MRTYFTVYWVQFDISYFLVPTMWLTGIVNVVYASKRLQRNRLACFVVRMHKNELFLFATQIRFLVEWNVLSTWFINLLLFLITNPKLKYSRAK